MRSVVPVKPVAAYQGGKRNLSRRIVATIDAVPHDAYCEVFVGMGGVFFRRGRAPRSEAINDYGRDVATLFRVLQRHYVAFLDMIRFQLTTRTEFDRLARTDPATLTDLERAARFLHLQRTTFGGKITSRSFGVSPGMRARFDTTKLQPLLEDVHQRLAGVTIECLPYAEFLSRYDRPGTLFYLDPPYWGGETDYGKGLFSIEDHARLAAELRKIAGRFVLSINDVPEIRALYRWKGCRIVPVRTMYSISGHQGATPAGELLVVSKGIKVPRGR